jgi:hypothetical protein
MDGSNPHIRCIRVFFRAVAGRAGDQRCAAEMVAVQESIVTPTIQPCNCYLQGKSGLRMIISRRLFLL